MILAAAPRTGYLPRALPIAEPPPPPEPEPEPDPVAPAPEAWVTHPAIPSDEGIGTLLADGTTLFTAYGGNWTGGNHYVATVDLATETAETGPLIPTEGFSAVRKIGSTIYLTWVDPTGAWNAAQGYSFTTDGGATWQERRVGPAYHFFDIVEHNGDLFTCGAGPAPDDSQRARVWRSTDGGNTWQVSLDIPHSPSGGNFPVRTYSLVVAGGSLYARTLNTENDGTVRTDRFNGSAWEPVPAISGAFMRGGFTANGIAYGNGEAFDGTSVIPYNHKVQATWLDASHVYGISRATDTIDRAPLVAPGAPEVTWTPWLTMDEGMGSNYARSAIPHGGYVYVGGTEGRIWRYTAP